MRNTFHGKIFLKGLIFALPIILTIAILVWVFQTAETVLAEPIKQIVPTSLHFPGMGILIALIIIYVIGFAIVGKVSRAAMIWLQKMIISIPVVNVVYKNINDMLAFISGGHEGDMESVVLVSVDGDKQLMGFVTQKESDIVSKKGEVIRAVYLPMSYQMGGYLIYVPDSKLTKLSITKKEAMRRILTAELVKAEEGLTLP